jgi:hypothetical protein
MSMQEEIGPEVNEKLDVLFERELFLKSLFFRPTVDEGSCNYRFCFPD